MDTNKRVKLDKNTLFYLSNFTLFGFSAIGILLLTYVQGSHLKLMLLEGMPVYLQIPIGLIAGLLVALLGIVIIRTFKMDSVTNAFSDLIESIQLETKDIVFYSICAGVGEEMLFRAGIQPIIGLWVTAVLFVAVHGYLNPKNKKLFYYAFYLIFFSALLGYLFAFVGIFAAMAAHALYDIIMFRHLMKVAKNKELSVNE